VDRPRAFTLNDAMHPALSVILFTTASGAGYGMLFWLGLLAPLDLLPVAASFGVTASLIGLALVTFGLMSSTLHLGHPERAWRAVTQWRTSWLSREGVAALIAYVPAVLFPLLWLITGTPGPLGFVSAAMAAVTVVCTGMIYASLKPIRQWSNPYVLPIYLLAAVFSGGACLAGVAAFWGASHLLAYASVVAAALTLAAKLAYWRSIDDRAGARTPADATGLGKLGTVRSLDPPNTQENYLLREMGYRIGRKHAARLRVIAVLLGFVTPIVLLAFIPALAAIAALLGLLVERWLFFAEATHTITLYYGRTA
jgi:sulfite dehydrogenase (quinone) subunit SoeC